MSVHHWDWTRDLLIHHPRPQRPCKIQAYLMVIIFTVAPSGRFWRHFPTTSGHGYTSNFEVTFEQSAWPFVHWKTVSWPVPLFRFGHILCWVHRKLWPVLCLEERRKSWRGHQWLPKELQECVYAHVCLFVFRCVCLHPLFSTDCHRSGLAHVRDPCADESVCFAFELDDIIEGKKKQLYMFANLLFCLCSSTAVAFHSPPVTIKKEPPSPWSDPSQSCSHKQIPNGEQCLYARYTCQQVQY